MNKVKHQTRIGKNKINQRETVSKRKVEKAIEDNTTMESDEESIYNTMEEEYNNN